MSSAGGRLIAASLSGLPWIALLVAAELAVDLIRLPSATAADLTRRVDAGSRRFLLFWLVGFCGLWATIFTGKPLVIFSLFAGVKILFEVAAALERAKPAATPASPGTPSSVAST